MNDKNKAMTTQDTNTGMGSKIAPAVALLLLGNTGLAEADLDTSDDDQSVTVPEPSTMSMLAAGVIVGGAVKYIRDKRKNKK